jgi:hypothetical protein
MAAMSGPVGCGHVVFGDHVGDADTPTWRKHSVHLGQHRGLVDGQIDHTVRDDHIDCAVGQWHLLDGALEEFHVRRTGLGRVRPSKGKHLVGHVHPIGNASLAHPTGREQHIDPASGTEIEHPFAGTQLGYRQRIPAAQARRQRLGRQLALLVCAV